MDYALSTRAPRAIATRQIFPLLWLLLLLGAGAPALAASSGADTLQPAATGSPDIGDTLWSDLKAGATDALLLFSAPGHFTLRQWGMVGWVLAGDGMSMVADDEVRGAFRRLHGTTGDKLTDFGTFYGNGIPAAGLVGVLYVGGLAFDSPGVRLAGRHLAQSVLYATIITGALKALLGRHRPFLDDGPFAYEGPSFKDQYNSHPSGHSTMAFAMASSLSADIDNPFATAGLYGLATLTGLTRIYADRHWMSDVFLGAAIGTVCGYGVTHLHPDDPNRSGLMIYPTLDGVALSWRF